VPQAMAQFVLKIELLSHIMGTTPILEMARAYGLRPRLWLLAKSYLSKLREDILLSCENQKAEKKTSISGQKTRIYSRFLHTVKTSLLR